MTSKEYLLSIGRRVEFYNKARKRATNYIRLNQIEDIQLQTSLILISAIWAANKLEQDLTDDDLYILFGLENKGDSLGTVYNIHPDMKEMSLGELFDITVESF